MTNDPCDFANTKFNFTPTFDFSIFENCTFDNISASGDPNVSGNKTVKTVFLFLFYCTASIGNFLLLAVMFKDPLKRFRNATSYFIINLCLADMLSAAGGITDEVFKLHPQNTTVQNIPLCINAIGIQCSLLVIMLFSLDRYMAIARAYTYKNITEKKQVIVTILILPWCFSVIALPVMYFTSVTKDVHWLFTLILAVDFIALSLATVTLHPYTYWVFLRRIKDLRKSSANHRQLLEENLKVARVLATTVLVVSICWITFTIPYFVAFCFHVSNCDRCFLNDTFQSFWKYYPLISSIRVTFNSVVYAWRLPLYRKSLKVILSTCGNRIPCQHINIISCSKGSFDMDKASKKTKSTSYEDNYIVENQQANECV
ncbi:substance-K receptor-like [Dendronephthya gigantea]|uniref:substance-K receptor-like n=1 Tax=Dendronephthya gigantea TaxID=151771 RepID=UPI00106BE4D4|nr:substance-K receptor-like [Dendronephthya gigantea]XP_028397728.1 substance-K receptor-like [Dendronephthya gigantea]XP_028397729.1 substance-K receptor-like [Dendronephthya gigantea]